MYRLLLVSDKEEIRSLYKRFSEWENLGFERPAVVSVSYTHLTLPTRS